MQLECM
jgi:hypothetical protein